MINEFICPGCVNGSDTKCGRFIKTDIGDGGSTCHNHHPGTMMFPGGTMMLGLPTGFNKVRENKIVVRVYEEVPVDKWNHLNIAVWAMEKDGYLFVRTFCPRIATSYIDVIKGGTLALVPQALDVSKFIDSID